MTSLCEIPNKCPECGRHQWCVSNFDKAGQLERALDALREVRELIDGYVDVVDGDYGVQRPNKAMRAVQLIDEVL